MVHTVLVVPGQGIGPECMTAALDVLKASGADLAFEYGSLGYPDAPDLLRLIQAKEPEVYNTHYGSDAPEAVGARLQATAKDAARAGGNINDFYKILLADLPEPVRAVVPPLVKQAERETLQTAARCDAVLKGALRTLDSGDDPSRNVTIRKAYEQYANIRRCVTLDPIAPGMPGADILFVRENLEDLYAAIEHRLARNYPQALRHTTPEGCELICRAAFELALRDGRRLVTALEKPNILKVTGGMFRDAFSKVAADYTAEAIGADRAVAAQFLIIDDGLAAIAATPERFDVVVTSNMFGDIGSDVAAKITGGVGLVSSNNVNPSNPSAVSMFETMGGTADDIAGEDKANPVALIDAAADMLLHIGGAPNVRAASAIRAAILEVLAEGYFIGDIREGPFQKEKGKGRLTTKSFTAHIATKVGELLALKTQKPSSTIRDLALERAEPALQPLFSRVLRAYDGETQEPAEAGSWKASFSRNLPPNPVRASSRIIGFDLFVDDSGMVTQFDAAGRLDATQCGVDPAVAAQFRFMTEIDIAAVFDTAAFGSLQAIRSFGQFLARKLDGFAAPSDAPFETWLRGHRVPDDVIEKLAPALLSQPAATGLSALQRFSAESLTLIQSFYLTRRDRVVPILEQHGFSLMRITSRGTEIFPTVCDLEKRDVDRYRVQLRDGGPLGDGSDLAQVQAAITQVLNGLATDGWVISEMMLNRRFTDAEGSNKGTEMAGASQAYASGLGIDYADTPRVTA